MLQLNQVDECAFFFSYADKNWSTPFSLRMKKLNLHSRIPSVRGLNAALPCQHTCNSSDCSTSWGRAFITVGEWGVSHMLMSLSVNMLQHNNQWWDACLVIQGEKCSYKTKQRACFTFFPPGYAEQADKQADWINKQYRSKEGCCVCQCSVLLPEKTRQWVGKYFVSDLCTRDFLCTFKLNKIICEGAGKGACCYEVTNKIFTDCQLLRVYKEEKAKQLPRLLSSVDESLFIISMSVSWQCQRFLQERNRLAVFAHLMFLTGSYSTGLQSTCGFLRCIFVFHSRMVRFFGNPTLWTLMHNKICEQVELFQ